MARTRTLTVYRATVRDDVEGKVYAWGATAKQARERLTDEDGWRKWADVKAVTIRDTRQGLADWLNTYFTRDNG